MKKKIKIAFLFLFLCLPFCLTIKIEASFQKRAVQNTVVSSYNGVYDGEYHGVSLNLPEGTVASYSETELDVDSELWSNEALTYKDYTENPVTVYVLLTPIEGEKTIESGSVSITKAPLTIAWTKTIVYYTGSYQTPVPEAQGGVKEEIPVLGEVQGGGTLVNSYKPSVSLTDDLINQNYYISTYAKTTFVIQSIDAILVIESIDSLSYGIIKTAQYSGFTIHANAIGVLGEAIDGAFSVTFAPNASDINQNNYLNCGSYIAQVSFVPYSNTNYKNTTGTHSFKVIQKVIDGFLWDYQEPFLEDSNTHYVSVNSILGLITGDEINLTIINNEASYRGDYTAQVTAIDNSNYALPIESMCQLDWKIKLRENETVTSSGVNITYDHLSHQINVAAEIGTIYYSLEDLEENDSNWTLTNIPFTNAFSTKVTVYYKVVEIGYDTVFGSETVLIQKKQIESFSWNQAYFVYDGEIKETYVTKMVGFIEGDSSNLVYSGNKKIDKGSYQASVVSIGNENYLLPEVTTYDYKIGKALIIASSSGFSGKYDGNTHQITVTYDVGTIYYSLSNLAETSDQWTTEAFIFKNQTNSTVYYMITDSNHETYFGSEKVVITKLTLTLKWEKTSFVYDGENHSPLCSVDEGFIQGEIPLITSVYGEKTNKGNYNASVSLKEEDVNQNYLLGNPTCPFEIVQKELSISTYSITDLVYGDIRELVFKDFEINAIFKGVNDDTLTGKWEITYNVNEEDMSKAVCLNAGTYFVNGTFTPDDSNYQPKTLSFSFKVNPKIIDKITFIGQASYPYDYQTHEISVDAIEGRILGDTFNLVLTGNKNKKAGKYEALVTSLGNENYALPSDKTLYSFAWEIVQTGGNNSMDTLVYGAFAVGGIVLLVLSIGGVVLFRRRR